MILTDSFFVVTKRVAKTAGKTIPKSKNHFEPITAIFPLGAVRYGTLFGTSNISKVRHTAKFSAAAIMIFMLFFFIDLW